MNFRIYPTQFYSHSGQPDNTLDPTLYLLNKSESLNL